MDKFSPQGPEHNRNDTQQQRRQYHSKYQVKLPGATGCPHRQY